MSFRQIKYALFDVKNNLYLFKIEEPIPIGTKSNCENNKIKLNQNGEVWFQIPRCIQKHYLQNITNLNPQNDKASSSR